MVFLCLLMETCGVVVDFDCVGEKLMVWCMM